MLAGKYGTIYGAINAKNLAVLPIANVGRYGFDGASRCAICPTGQYTESAGQSTCQVCPAQCMERSKEIFGTHQIVTTNADGAQSVFAADIDGDGDMDLASASYNDGKIAWYENTDGKGTFGFQQIVTTNTDSAQSVFAADIDGDGDMDLASASAYDDKIAWYENTDGKGTFGSQQDCNDKCR